MPVNLAVGTLNVAVQGDGHPADDLLHARSAPHPTRRMRTALAETRRASSVLRSSSDMAGERYRRSLRSAIERRSGRLTEQRAAKRATEAKAEDSDRLQRHPPSAQWGHDKLRGRRSDG